MKKNNSLADFFGYLALVSGSIWLGAYLARLITTYQMFEATELTLKSYVTDSNISAIFQTTLPLVSLTFFSYLLMVISFTLYLASCRIKLKNNGWLLIVALIVYLTFPFEVMLLIVDYKLFILFMNEQFTSELVLPLVIERIIKLSSFSIILLLSYISIPYFLVFRPFTKNLNNEN